MLAFADRLSNVQVSASMAMTDLARELVEAGQQVIGLSSGEPDFPTPPGAEECDPTEIPAGKPAGLCAR
jgi:aspartate aminotransferase